MCFGIFKTRKPQIQKSSPIKLVLIRELVANPSLKENLLLIIQLHILKHK